MLSCRSLQPGANEDIVMQAIRQNIRCQQHMAAAVSSNSEQGNFHPDQLPCKHEKGLSESSAHHADLTEHLHKHALRHRNQTHCCQHSYQPSNHSGHLHRSSSSSNRAVQQSRAAHQSSMREGGTAGRQAAALLTHRQQPAGSSCCSMRGFASMPDRILQKDSQHDMGSSSHSERGFTSTSEPAQQSAALAAEPAQQAFVPPGRAQNAPASPWTPTRELRKRNFLPRRMGHLMEVLHAACPQNIAARHDKHCETLVPFAVHAPSAPSSGALCRCSTGRPRRELQSRGNFRTLRQEICWSSHWYVTPATPAQASAGTSHHPVPIVHSPEFV